MPAGFGVGGEGLLAEFTSAFYLHRLKGSTELKHTRTISSRLNRIYSDIPTLSLINLKEGLICL